MIELLLTESEKETSKETKEMWTITTYKNNENIYVKKHKQLLAIDPRQLLDYWS